MTLRASALRLPLLLATLALASACSSEETGTETEADTATGCNLFTGVGCEDSGTTDTGTGVADTGTTDTGGALDPAEESAAILAFCADAVASICDHLYDCSAEFSEKRAEFEAAFGFSDRSSCKISIAVAFEPRCVPEANAASSGRVRRDPARLSRCEALLAEAECSTFVAGSAERDACFTPLPVVGSAANGISCARTSECSDPLSRCSTFDPAALSASGMCEPALGAACQTADTCLPSQYCDQPGNDWEVAPGLPGVCAPRAAGGAACEDQQGCEAGLTCNSSAGAGQGGEPINGTCR
jgi:hypothetical protein